MRIHDVQGHLHGIECKAVLSRYLEHVQVYARIFVAREPDKANLPGCACFNERRVRSLIIEDAVRILKSNDFMVLDKVYLVHTQAAKRLVQLSGSFLPGTSINLGHDKGSLAITIAKRFAHS